MVAKLRGMAEATVQEALHAAQHDRDDAAPAAAAVPALAVHPREPHRAARGLHRALRSQVSTSRRL